MRLLAHDDPPTGRSIAAPPRRRIARRYQAGQVPGRSTRHEASAGIDHLRLRWRIELCTDRGDGFAVDQDVGAPRQLGSVELPAPPMLHDFIATDTHLVFFIYDNES